MDEINCVGNIVVNNNQHLRMLGRRSWKGLRKFYSHKSLVKEHYYKDYPHLSRTFTRDDRVDRPNPKLPPLHKIDEVLFVNEPEPIRPDTVSEGDSVTSNPEDFLEDSDIDLLTPVGDDYVSPTSKENLQAINLRQASRPRTVLLKRLPVMMLTHRNSRLSSPPFVQLLTKRGRMMHR